MIALMLGFFLLPIAIWFLSGLLGSFSKTLGMLILAMGFCSLVSMFLGPWVFIVGLLWVTIARINYDPSKEN